MNLRELTAKVDGNVKKKLRPFIMALDRYSPYPLFYTFIMTRQERELFDTYVKNAEHYLEFGSGGSTIRVLQKSNATIYSVESSLDWVKEMSRYVLVNYWNKKRLFFHHVNIGKTEMWGFPASEDTKNLFPRYSSAIFDEIAPKKLDVVLVDGRFRVACVLRTILYLFPDENTTILVHDIWNRKEYHIILDYMTVINRADTLGVFKIKKDIDLNLVRRDYELYKFIPD